LRSQRRTSWRAITAGDRASRRDQERIGLAADAPALDRHAGIGGDGGAVRRDDLQVIDRPAARLVGRAEHGGGTGDVEQLAALVGQDEDAVRLGHWQKIHLICHFCQYRTSIQP